MTLEKLAEDWQQYEIQVDVTFTEGKDKDKRITGNLILKDRYFVCFIVKEENAVMFDPGGHDPRCLTLRCDDEDNCYMKFPGGAWLKIGIFARLK